MVCFDSAFRFTKNMLHKTVICKIRDVLETSTSVPQCFYGPIQEMATRSVLSSGLDGKDVVIVATREELATPSKVSLPEPDPTPGLILADGSINWACPCLGGMSTGPCGSQFREAFSCFHYSDADPKGSDCYEKFSVMQECMSHYPDLYGKDDDDEMAAAMDAAGSDKHEPADVELHKEQEQHEPRAAALVGPAGDAR